MMNTYLRVLGVIFNLQLIFDSSLYFIFGCTNVDRIYPQKIGLKNERISAFFVIKWVPAWYLWHAVEDIGLQKVDSLFFH